MCGMPPTGCVAHHVRAAPLQVRQKLVNTRKRMEDILGGLQPNDDDEWYETTDALAQPLLSCYWSLWECGSGIVAEGVYPSPCFARASHS